MVLHGQLCVSVAGKIPEQFEEYAEECLVTCIQESAGDSYYGAPELHPGSVHCGRCICYDGGDADFLCDGFFANRVDQ